MKVKLFSLFNKLWKKFAIFGVFSFTTSSAPAQTIYQCTACPEGMTTGKKGATSLGECKSAASCELTGTNIVVWTTSSGSKTLSQGWYRIYMKTKKGANGNNHTRVWDVRNCGEFTGSETNYRASCSATGGEGGNGVPTQTYLVYLSKESTAKYTYSSSKITLEITNSIDGTKTFTATHGSTGTNATSVRGGYPCYTPQNGSKGANGSFSVTGTKATDKPLTSCATPSDVNTHEVECIIKAI